jgi:hypothetical protein
MCLLLGKLGKAMPDNTPPISMAYRYQTGICDVWDELLLAVADMNPVRDILRLQAFHLAFW